MIKALYFIWCLKQSTSIVVSSLIPRCYQVHMLGKVYQKHEKLSLLECNKE